MQQLIKHKNYQDPPIYSVVRDAKYEMKDLFQCCKKANTKYVTNLSELEVENEMKWLDHL